MTALPLAGLRVLDFTHIVAGPFATRILGDLGADVVKIHTAARATGARADDAPAYLCWNRNKRALALNFATAAARVAGKQLAAKADVLVENFSTGVLDRWGLGYEALRAENPRLIYVSLPGVSRGGPWSEYITYAPTIHALCGLTALSGPPGRVDVGVGYSYNDHLAGLQAVVAVLAALEHRRHSGRGQQIELPQLQVGIHTIAPALLAFLAGGPAAQASGNQPDFFAAAPHDCYPCAGSDRWIAIAVLTDEQWRALRLVMGSPDWAESAQFDHTAGRVAQRTTIDASVAAWTRLHDAYELQQRCQAAGVPAGVVQNGPDLVERDRALQAAGFLFEFAEAHPRAGKVYGDRLPLHFSRTPVVDYRRPRTVGEDNAAVLRDWLGLDAAAVRTGEAAGIYR